MIGTGTLLVLELLPYLVHGLALYAEKVGDTQQLIKAVIVYKSSVSDRNT